MNAEMDELRRAVAELIGEDPETWPDHGNGALAIAATVALLVKQTKDEYTTNSDQRTLNIAKGIFNRFHGQYLVDPSRARSQLIAGIQCALRDAEKRGAEGVPVMWRVKVKAGDGWISFSKEDQALEFAERIGSEVQGLCVRDGQ